MHKYVKYIKKINPIFSINLNTCGKKITYLYQTELANIKWWYKIILSS